MRKTERLLLIRCFQNRVSPGGPDCLQSGCRRHTRSMRKTERLLLVRCFQDRVSPVLEPERRSRRMPVTKTLRAMKNLLALRPTASRSGAARWPLLVTLRPKWQNGAGSYSSTIIVSTSSQRSAGVSVSCRAVSVCAIATSPLPARSFAVENFRPSAGAGSFNT
jgi:hypothetical protein